MTILIDDYLYVLCQYMRDSGGSKRALPVAANTPHGAVGEARLHPHPAPIALYEATAVQV